MSEIISREELEKDIEWAVEQLATFRARPIYNVADARKTEHIIIAAYAHLETFPKMKEIDVWHVEYASGPSGFGVPHLHAPFCLREDAERNAAALQRESYSFVRVTGPHKHQVPA